MGLQRYTLAPEDSLAVMRYGHKSHKSIAVVLILGLGIGAEVAFQCTWDYVGKVYTGGKVKFVLSFEGSLVKEENRNHHAGKPSVA